MTGESDPSCADRRLLIQADLDGELDVAASAALAAHVDACPQCARLRDHLAALSARLRTEIPSHAAPAALRAAVLRRTAPANVTRLARRPARRGLLSFGAGAAIAASLLLLLLPPRDDTDAQLIGLHLRALQPGHLTDVVSTDQHTVKPWFDGRIDFAPTVKDLAAAGFPLLGGRLDVLENRPVAALVYGHGKHMIDVVVRPDQGGAAEALTRQGYAVVGWASGGLAYRAVSDVGMADLQDFARLWQATP